MVGLFHNNKHKVNALNYGNTFSLVFCLYLSN